MNRVSESIFSGKVGIENIIIPMAEVQWVEREQWGVGKFQYKVMMKNSFIVLKHFMGEKFIRAWVDYRHEVEGGKDAFIMQSDDLTTQQKEG